MYTLKIRTSDGYEFQRTDRPQAEQDAVVEEWRNARAFELISPLQRGDSIFQVSNSKGTWNFDLNSIIFMTVEEQEPNGVGPLPLGRTEMSKEEKSFKEKHLSGELISDDIAGLLKTIKGATL